MFGHILSKTTLLVLAIALMTMTQAFAHPSEGMNIPSAEVYIEAVRDSSSSIDFHKKATIRFKVSVYEADLAFESNAASLDSLSKWIKAIIDDENSNLDKVTVRSAASPEGGHTYNVSLAKKRAKSVADIIVERTGIDPSLIELSSVGPDYQGLREMVDTTSNFRYKDEVLNILDNTPLYIYKDGKPVDGKKKQLMDLRGGRPWFWMLSNLYPTLRRTEVVIDYTERIPMQPEVRDTVVSIEPVEGAVDTAATPEAVEDPIVAPAEPQEVVSAPAQEPEMISKPLVAFGTNALYLAAMTPNFNVEFPLGEHFSAGVNYLFPWFVWNGNSRAYELIHLELFARYWFNPTAPLTGWFAGLNAGGAYFDIQPKGYGYQGEASEISLEVGYAWPLGKRWTFNVSAAAGWMGAKYRKYETVESATTHLVELYSGRYYWVGPTRLNAGFTYMFNHNVRKK